MHHSAVIALAFSATVAPALALPILSLKGLGLDQNVNINNPFQVEIQDSFGSNPLTTRDLKELSTYHQGILRPTSLLQLPTNIVEREEASGAFNLGSFLSSIFRREDLEMMARDDASGAFNLGSFLSSIFRREDELLARTDAASPGRPHRAGRPHKSHHRVHGAHRHLRPAASSAAKPSAATVASHVARGPRKFKPHHHAHSHVAHKGRSLEELD
ncbi:hypothetical protein EUX98_g2312 [Antrodiella citrinella]|uniref:Uncharacterized protein n=1 Tax=Antrodiella citrinella TaxID=2447956 RepID=A0A4S4MZB3_9APHY|nr:hypothetical protein EUX98_g2312 [Antrodiella citrinella]